MFTRLFVLYASLEHITLPKHCVINIPYPSQLDTITAFKSMLILFTLHAQREQGKVISVGVHIYIILIKQVSVKYDEYFTVFS